MTEPLHINTEGVVQVGELDTRLLREVKVAEDYRNARIAGATGAYTEVSHFAQSVIAGAGPYDDVRALHALLVWVADKIREETCD